MFLLSISKKILKQNYFKLKNTLLLINYSINAPYSFDKHNLPVWGSLYWLLMKAWETKWKKNYTKWVITFDDNITIFTTSMWITCNIILLIEWLMWIIYCTKNKLRFKVLVYHSLWSWRISSLLFKYNTLSEINGQLYLTSSLITM